MNSIPKNTKISTLIGMPLNATGSTRWNKALRRTQPLAGSVAALLATAAFCGPLSHSSLSAIYSWTGATGGDWATAGNWSTKPGAGDTALFNTTLGSVLNASGTDQSVGGISFDTNAGTAGGSFAIGATGGNKLTLANAGTIQILATLSGTGKTIAINSPIVLTPGSTTTAGTYTFSNNSADATNVLIFGGPISASTTSATETLTLSGSNTGANTISGNISNGSATNFALTKSGFGNWTLSGSNTYTGQTTIQSGTLTLDFSGAGAPVRNLIAAGNTVSGAGSLVMGNASDGAALQRPTLSLLGNSGTTNSQTFAGVQFYYGASHLNLTPGTSGTVSAQLGNIFKSMSNAGGTLDIGLPSGASATTTNNNGILGGGFTVNGVTWATSAATALANVATWSGSNVLTVASGAPANGTQVTFQSTVPGASGLTASSTYYVLNPGGSATSFQLATTPGGTPIVLVSSTSNGTLNKEGALTGMATSSYTNSYSAGGNLDAIASGTLTSSPYTLRFNTGSPVTVSIADATIRQLQYGGILVTGSVGANTSKISGGILQGQARRDLFLIQNNPLGTLQIDSQIVGTGGQTTQAGITRTGVGTILLTAANTYTGITRFFEGTTIVTGDYKPAVTLTGTATASNATLAMASTTGVIVGEEVSNASYLTGNNTYVVTAVTGTSVTLSGNAPSGGAGSFVFGGAGGLGITTGASPVEVQAGATLQIGNGGTTGSLMMGQGVLDLGTLTFNRTDALTFGNAISGAGAVNQSGSGTTILTGANTYTGPTAINSGTLQLGDGTNGNDGTMTTSGIVNNAVLVYNPYSSQTAGYPISGSGPVLKLGIGATTFSGANAFSGGLTVQSGTVIASTSASALGGSGTGTVRLGNSTGSSPAALLAGGATSAVTYANPIVLATNASTGTLTIGDVGTNISATFSGGVTGTNNLVLNTNAGTGTIAFTGTINNAGTVTNAGTASTGNIASTANAIPSASITINMPLGANVTGVIQNGPSDLVLGGNNSAYTNGITIQSGRLDIANYAGSTCTALGGSNNVITLGNASSNVTLNYGARLNGLNFGGGATIPGRINVNGTGTNVISVTDYNPVFSGPITLGGGGTNLTAAITTNNGSALTFSGGVTGTGNIIASVDFAHASDLIVFNTNPVNNVGTITFNNDSVNGGTAGTGIGTNVISGGVGSNVTAINQNSNTNPLTVSTSAIAVNPSVGTTLTESGSALFTVSGGVSGTGNLILNNNSAAANGLTVSTSAINNAGTVTNSGTGSGATLISAVIGANVTAINQNSNSSPLTISTNAISANPSVGTTLTESGSALFTVSGGVSGTGNLILNNNSAAANGLTVSTSAINNAGTVTNSGTGAGSTLISAVIGVNVTGLTQNSASSTLILNGANTYAGNTLISSGTLQLGNNLALQNSVFDPSGAGTLAFSSGIITPTFGGLTSSTDFTMPSNVTGLTLNPASGVTATYGGNLGGGTAMSLTKSGSGIQVLTASNSYTGATILSAGVLSISSDDNLNGTNSALTFNGGTLQITGIALSSLNPGRTTTFASGAIAGFDINNAANSFTVTQTLNQGTGGLLKAGAGTLILTTSNSFTGTTTITGGTLQLGDGTPGHDGSIINSSITNNGTLYFNAYGDVNAGAISGTGGIVKTGTGTLNMDYTGGSVNYSGPTLIHAGILRAFYNYIVTPGSRWTIDSGATVALDQGGGRSLSIGSLVGSGTVVTKGALTLGGDNTTDANFTGTIYGWTGPVYGAVIKNGTGAQMLSGSNSYTGGTAINSGTLTVGNVNALGVTSGNLTVNGGALDLNGYSVTVGALSGSSGGVITSGTTGALTLTTSGTGISTFSGVIQNGSADSVALAVSGASAGSLTLTGSNSYTGGTTLASGRLQVGNNAALGSGPLTLTSGTFSSSSTTGYTVTNALSINGNVGLGDATNTGPLTFSGNADLNGATRTLTVNSGVTLTGTIGNGALTKAGAGTLTLTGNCTYSGTTTVSAGALQLGDGTAGNDATLATSGIVNNSQLRFNLYGNRSIGSLLSGNGTLWQQGPGTLTITGSNTQNLISVTSGTLQLGDGTAGNDGSLTLASGISNNGTLYYNGYGDQYETYAVSGAGAIVKTGTGTLYMNYGWTGESFTGPMWIQAGTLRVWIGYETPGSRYTIDSGALLTMDQGGGRPLSIGSLVGSGTVRVKGDLTVGGDNTTDANFSGAVVAGGGVGQGGLIKIGAGTQMLSGSNNYSGGTTVNSGNLVVGNTSALGWTSGKVAVNGGALDLNGYSVSIGVLSGSSGGTITSGLGGNVTLTTTGTVNSTFAGVIQDGSGTIALIKSGTGTLTLTGSNNYSGTTTVSAGGLQLGDGTAGHDGSLATIGIVNNAQLTYNLYGNQSASYLISGSGALSKQGPGTLTLTGSNSQGSISLNSGTLQLGDGTAGHDGSLSVTSGLTNNGTLSFNGCGDQYEGYAISGSGGLVKTGSGTLYLSYGTGGQVSYTGPTSIQAGVLKPYYSYSTPVSRYSIDSGATLALDQGGGRNLSIGSLVGSGTVISKGALTLGGDNTTDANFTGTIYGWQGPVYGAVIITGSGTQMLSGSNSYTGGTVINSGSLTVGNVCALGATSGSLAVNGGTLDLNGYSVSIGVLSGSSGGTITNMGSGTSTLTAVISGTSTYAGNIANGTGALALSKTGSGTLVLGGAMTMAGLAATGGTVQLAQSGSIGAVSIAAGATVALANHSGSTYNVLDTSSLTLSGSTSTLDLGNNAAIVRATTAGASAANLATIQGLVNQASDGLSWDKPGITSSAAYADLSAAGVLVVMVYDNSAIALSDFEGVHNLGYYADDGTQVDLNQVLLKLTYVGDFNADGTIDSSDYALLDTYAQAGSTLGDLTGDGFVDSSDYGLLDTGYQNQVYGVLAGSAGGAAPQTALATSAAAPASPQGVPEPGTWGLLAAASALLGLRRQRRSH